MSSPKVKSSYLIVLVLILMLASVVVIGRISYFKISNVVSDIQISGSADDGKEQLGKLVDKTTTAELSIKTYVLTKEEQQLDLYYQTVSEADSLMEALYDTNRYTLLQKYFNLSEFDSLINRRFEVLNSYLLFQDKNRVDAALARIRNSLKDHQNKHGADVSERGKKRNFLHRILGKKDTLQEARTIETEIDVIQKTERRIHQTQTQEELVLLQEDQRTTSKIDSMIAGYLSRLDQESSQKSEMTANNVRSINRQITLFFVVMAILVAFVIFLILRYVKANMEFRSTLKKAKQDAEELAETKERFLNNMSHEIRTPMNAISGFVEQLSKSELNADQLEKVTIIRKSSDYLLHIINEILEYNKLESGRIKLDIRDFDLKGLLTDLVKTLKPISDSKDIKLECNLAPEVPQYLQGDPYKINQILVNLVGNAIKFTHHGGVTVDVSSILRNDQQMVIRFQVSDTGIGMTKEQMNRIFDEFEQAEVATTRTYGGTGLGLSITKRMVDLFGGQLHVESTPNSGSCFTVELPMAIGNADNIYVVRDESAQGSKLSNLKILIVDDEPYNRKLLTAILSQHDVRLTEAVNGKEALAELKRNKYDLVLMDTRMPVMDGVKATTLIRKDPKERVSKVKVIALSAAVSEKDQQNYKNAGINDFLPKPFKESDLIAKISSVLNENHTVNGVPVDDDLSNEDGLDFSHLKQLCQGDQGFYKEMLETFITTVSEGVKKIRNEYELEHNDMVAEYAHQTASPCKHLNAIRLYDMFKELENGIRTSENPDISDSAIKAIEKEAGLVVSEVQREIDRL